MSRRIGATRRRVRNIVASSASSVTAATASSEPSRFARMRSLRPSNDMPTRTKPMGAPLEVGEGGQHDRDDAALRAQLLRFLARLLPHVIAGDGGRPLATRYLDANIAGLN